MCISFQFETHELKLHFTISRKILHSDILKMMEIFVSTMEEVDLHSYELLIDLHFYT